MRPCVSVGDSASHIGVFAGGRAGESGFLQKAGSPAFSPCPPCLLCILRAHSGQRDGGIFYRRRGWLTLPGPLHGIKFKAITRCNDSIDELEQC